MKNTLKYIGLLGLVLQLYACGDETLVDETLSNINNGAVLRNLEVNNGLDISDASSSYSITLEAQDAQNGNLLKEVRVNVGFDDNTDLVDDDDEGDSKATTSFMTIPASSFSPGDRDLPVFTFTATMDELLDHVGLTLGEVNIEDEFEIEFTMELTDGRIFDSGNASNDITRTGTFSFFNSQFDYNAEIGDPRRLAVEELSVSLEDNFLKSGSIDTVFMTFDRESSKIITPPTVTRVSREGNLDDAIIGKVEGPITRPNIDGIDEDQEFYYFLYRAGMALTDTIDFTLSGAEAVAGFEMNAKTIEEAYIIDNAAPEVARVAENVSVEDGEIGLVSLDLVYPEVVAKGKVKVVIESEDFDMVTIEMEVIKGDVVENIDFIPRVGAALIPAAEVEMDITITEVMDLAGNVASETVTVTLFD